MLWEVTRLLSTDVARFKLLLLVPYLTWLVPGSDVFQVIVAPDVVMFVAVLFEMVNAGVGVGVGVSVG